MAHDKVYGICENKSMVEVSPKTEVDKKASKDVATQSANGLMSSADKKTLDNVPDTYVKKSGDTMTGELTFKRNAENVIQFIREDKSVGDAWHRQAFLQFFDGDKNLGFFQTWNDANSTGQGFKSINWKADGTEVSAFLSLVAGPTGVSYLTCTAPPSTSDNSTKIPTTGWVNSASTLVHRTGNESIAGNKTFTGVFAHSGTAYNPIRIINSTADVSVGTQSNGKCGFQIFDKNSVCTAQIYNAMKTVDSVPYSELQISALNKKDDSTTLYSTIYLGVGKDGRGYCKIPIPASTASSNEAVTASWVNTKISGLTKKVDITCEWASGTNSADLTGLETGDLVFVNVTVKISSTVTVMMHGSFYHDGLSAVSTRVLSNDGTYVLELIEVASATVQVKKIGTTTTYPVQFASACALRSV